MSSQLLHLKDFTGPGFSAPWVLIIGGLTRVGNQRARRAIEIARAANLSVLWFDGYGDDANSDESQAPLPDEDSADSIILLYKEAERHLLLNRLGRAISKSRTTRRLSRKTVRPLVAATRSYRNWRLLRKQIRMLESAPDYIVWCDDYCISTAWHSARRWPNAEVRMDMAQQ